MTTAEIRTTLPCNWPAWEASCAEEWWGHAKKTPETSFQSTLEAYLDPDSPSITGDIDAFSYLLVLNGLLSIQCEMKEFDKVNYGT